MSAFLYLVWAGGRNRVGTVLRRVRKPRYAAALVVGALYIWAFLFRPATHTVLSNTLLSQPSEMIVSLLAMLTLMGSWVFGSDTTALAFSQAEVSLLFPAPVSRRALIGYKLFRAQIAIVVNSLIWVFVLRRGGGTLPSPLRAIALWALFSTMNLHRLGAALIRSSWREHGRAGARRNVVSIVAFTAISAMLVAGLVVHRAELLAADGFGAFFTALGRVLAVPPASIALWPFHLVVAPSFAGSVTAWSAAIAPAVVVLVIHGWWVLRTDAAFEEAAIEASAERARRVEARARRSVSAAVPRSVTSTLSLASVGRPALAIVWKNMLCLRRTAQLRAFVSPLVMSVVVGAAATGSGAGPSEVVGVSALALSGMLLLLGGRLIRNDLRQDMQHLPLIKSLPVPSTEIVLAEVASAALPIALVQVLLLVIAYIAATLSGSNPIGAGTSLGLLVAAPFGVVALNGALLTIQNGTAVLFPAWVRLGPVVSTGVEALGQNLLVTIGNLGALGVALVIPALIAWSATEVLKEPRPIALALVVIVAAAVLAAETYCTMRYLGRALERAEPQALSG